MPTNFNTMILEASAGPKKASIPQTAIQSFDGSFEAMTGTSVAISGDGSKLVIGESTYTGFDSDSDIPDASQVIDEKPAQFISAGSFTDDLDLSESVHLEVGDTVIVGYSATSASTPDPSGWTRESTYSTGSPSNHYTRTVSRVITGSESWPYTFVGGGSKVYSILRYVNQGSITGYAERSDAWDGANTASNELNIAVQFFTEGYGTTGYTNGVNVSSGGGSVRLSYLEPDGTNGIGDNSGGTFNYGSVHYLEMTAQTGIVDYPVAIEINGDGDKFYTATSNTIIQYNLSSDWDLDSSSLDYTFEPVLDGGVTIEDVKFKTDGSNVFVKYSNNTMQSFKLEVDWDLETILSDTPYNASKNYSKLFLTYDQDVLYTFSSTDTLKFEMSTAKQISTATVSEVDGLVGIVDGFISDDGSKFISLNSESQIEEHDLTSNNDLSSITSGLFTGQSDTIPTVNATSYDVVGPFSSMTGVEFNGDGTEMYIIEDDTASIRAYSLSVAYDPSTASYIDEENGGREAYSFKWSPDGIQLVYTSTTGRMYYDTSVSPAYDYKEFDTGQYETADDENGDGLTHIGNFQFSPNGYTFYGLVYEDTNIRIIQYDTPYYWRPRDQNVPAADRVTIDTVNSAVDNPHFYITPDGSFLYYHPGIDNIELQIFTMSTPWDIQTLSSTPVQTIALDSRAEMGMNIVDNGTKAFFVDNTNSAIVKVDLDTPHSFIPSNNIPNLGDTNGYHTEGDTTFAARGSNGITEYSTANSTLSIASIYTANTNLDSVSDITFNEDGTSAIVTDGNTTVVQLTPNVAWTLASGASESVMTANASILEGKLVSNNDILFLRTVDNDLHKYTVANGDISNTTFVEEIALNANASSFDVSSTGDYLYVAYPNTSIETFTLETAFDLSNTTSQGMKTFSFLPDDLDDIQMSDDGSTLYLTSNSAQYSTATANDYVILNGIDLDNAYSFTASFMDIGSNGSVMFVGSDISSDIKEFTLDPAWSVKDAVLANTHSTSYSDMKDLTFSRDGSRMYVFDANNSSDILGYNHTLDSPWEFSVANTVETFDTGINDSGQDISLMVSIDGDVKYELSGNTVTEVYLLADFAIGKTPIDFTSEDNDVGQVTFNSTGSKLYAAGNQNNEIFQYDLDIPYSLGTAQYSGNSLDVSGETTSPKNVVMADDSTLIVQHATANSYQYNISDTSDISSAIYSDQVFSYSTKIDSLFANGGKDFYMLHSNGAVWQYDIPIQNTQDLNYLQIVVNAFDDIGATTIYDNADNVMTLEERKFFVEDSIEEGTDVDISENADIMITQNVNDNMSIYRSDGSSYIKRTNISNVDKPKISNDGNVIVWKDTSDNDIKSAITLDDGITWNTYTVAAATAGTKIAYSINETGDVVHTSHNETHIVTYKRTGTSWALDANTAFAHNEYVKIESDNSGNRLVTLDDTGDVNVLVRDADNATKWTFESETTIESGLSNTATIAINGSGTIVAIGNPNVSTGGQPNSGSVSLWGKYGNTWTLDATLDMEDFTSAQANAQFGAAISINTVGNEIVVGAPGVNSTNGAVYRYRY